MTGLDVSREAVELFREKWPGCKGVVGGILAHDLAPESFDVVVVVGGLHHVHPQVEEAVAEIRRLLKPRGFSHTLVLNSMILRVPRRLKQLHGAPVMAAEAALNPLFGRRLSCSVSCQWLKIV